MTDYQRLPDFPEEPPTPDAKEALKRLREARVDYYVDNYNSLVRILGEHHPTVIQCLVSLKIAQFRASWGRKRANA